MQGEFALGTGVLPPPVPLAQPSEPPTKAALHSLAIVLRGVSLYLPFRRIGGPLRPPQSPMVVAPPLPCGRASSRHCLSCLPPRMGCGKADVYVVQIRI